MSQLLSIGAAIKAPNVSTSTLRRLETVVCSSRSGPRTGSVATTSLHWVPGISTAPPCRCVAYPRVSSHDQRADLERQKQALELYCAAQGWPFDIIADLRSGMNYYKKSLQCLLDEIVAGDVGRLVQTHKDRLLRFGAELVFALCEARNVEVVIINRGVDTAFEEDLASDVIEIVNVFSARLYGSRSHRNQKLIDGVRRVVQEAQC